MKILHLFSDYKWTGPAEPAVEMASAMKALGHEVDFQCMRMVKEVRDSVIHHAKTRDLEVGQDLHLRKHFSLWHNFQDARWLRDHGDDYDLVITHRRQDHLIAAWALRSQGPLLVRVSHEGRPLTKDWRHRFAMRHTDLLAGVSAKALDQDKQSFGAQRSSYQPLSATVDRGRFNRNRVHKNFRQEWDIKDDEVLVGIVARMQRHRRFDVLLKAVKQLFEACPQARFVIVGRGTHEKEVARDVAESLGLLPRLVFAGYHREHYVEALAALQAKVFLVPGSDGSCRAVRQAFSLGIPVIAAQRGMLPELVQDGQSGLVLDDTADELAQAMIKVVKDDSLRERLSQGAAEQARLQHDLLAVTASFCQQLSDLMGLKQRAR